MSDTVSKIDIIGLAENLKSLLIMCEIENSLMLDILRNTTSTKSYQLMSIHSQVFQACGDNPDNNQSKKPGKTDLDSKTSLKEHLSMLIKNTDKENLKLREWNVKLKQESKIQDKKIRDLNHKIMVYERRNRENQSQKNYLKDLKSTLEEKTSDIVTLKKKLDNMKTLLNKEKTKTKILPEHQRKCYTSKVNRQLNSKVDELIEKIDLLLEENEQKNYTSYTIDKSCIEKTLNTLKKLMKYSTKLNREEQNVYRNLNESFEINLNKTWGIHSSKSDVSTQISDEIDFEENQCKDMGSFLIEKETESSQSATITSI